MQGSFQNNVRHEVRRVLRRDGVANPLDQGAGVDDNGHLTEQRTSAAAARLLGELPGLPPQSASSNKRARVVRSSGQYAPGNDNAEMHLSDSLQQAQAQNAIAMTGNPTIPEAFWDMLKHMNIWTAFQPEQQASEGNAAASVGSDGSGSPTATAAVRLEDFMKFACMQDHRTPKQLKHGNIDMPEWQKTSAADNSTEMTDAIKKIMEYYGKYIASVYGKDDPPSGLPKHYYAMFTKLNLFFVGGFYLTGCMMITLIRWAPFFSIDDIHVVDLLEILQVQLSDPLLFLWIQLNMNRHKQVSQMWETYLRQVNNNNDAGASANGETREMLKKRNRGNICKSILMMLKTKIQIEEQTLPLPAPDALAGVGGGGGGGRASAAVPSSSSTSASGTSSMDRARNASAARLPANMARTAAGGMQRYLAAIGPVGNERTDMFDLSMEAWIAALWNQLSPLQIHASAGDARKAVNETKFLEVMQDQSTEDRRNLRDWLGIVFTDSNVTFANYQAFKEKMMHTTKPEQSFRRFHEWAGIYEGKYQVSAIAQQLDSYYAKLVKGAMTNTNIDVVWVPNDESEHSLMDSEQFNKYLWEALQSFLNITPYIEMPIPPSAAASNGRSRNREPGNAQNVVARAMRLGISPAGQIQMDIEKIKSVKRALKDIWEESRTFRISNEIHMIECMVLHRLKADGVFPWIETSTTISTNTSNSISMLKACFLLRRDKLLRYQFAAVVGKRAISERLISSSRNSIINHHRTVNWAEQEYAGFRSLVAEKRAYVAGLVQGKYSQDVMDNDAMKMAMTMDYTHMDSTAAGGL